MKVVQTIQTVVPTFRFIERGPKELSHEGQNRPNSRIKRAFGGAIFNVLAVIYCLNYHSMSNCYNVIGAQTW